VNKVVRIEVESWEKNTRVRSVRRGIRKWRAKAPREREKGPKNIRKFFLYCR